MSDHPFYECVDAASALIEKGADVYQKFTCAKCGSRQTMEEKNKFFKTGRCEECGHVTDVESQGCNYLVHAHV
jgi:transcription elongation factor Elf1